MRMLRAGALVAVVGCGGVVANDDPRPSCKTTEAIVDCTANDCHVLREGGIDPEGRTVSYGSTVRGECAIGERCVVWPHIRAEYGTCQ